MKANKRYGVRRFCPAGLRPDCFEVYDLQTDKCASFGMTKRDAEKTAKAMNTEGKKESHGS